MTSKYINELVSSMGGGGGVLKNYNNIGFLSNNGTVTLKNHKATKLAFNVEPT